MFYKNVCSRYCSEVVWLNEWGWVWVDGFIEVNEMWCLFRNYLRIYIGRLSMLDVVYWGVNDV